MKTILVAVDFSIYSAEVIRLAVNLAHALQAELAVVNVLNQRDVDAMEMVERTFPSLNVSQFIRQATEDRLQRIEKLLLEEGAGRLNVKKAVKIGVPYREILKAVDEEQADLLVMGTRGRSSLSDALFGSTAEKVFQRCPVALLSVRPEPHAQEAAER
jgi:nucleotide-binding universal stress UspA family protein